MKRLQDGYEVALKAAQDWSQEAYLESVFGIYRLEGGQWHLQRGHYIFVDRTRMQYIGVTLDIKRRRLIVEPPGRVGGKGGFVTTSHFDLEGNPLDDRSALSEALRLLPAECEVQEATIIGCGYIDQSWWVKFTNPRKGLLSPIFLPTIFVDAITGEVKLSSGWKEGIWCRP